MSRIEILAPVGGAQQLEAAVRCGADAVYLGGKGFNARRNAENFSELSLAEAVKYCHARNVRVHVTVNTLILDEELEALEQEIRSVAQSGADAAIIQDLTVMRLFKEKCPSVERHASTQAVVHNSDGAKLMRNLGFTRVVLARELSLKEIEKIISKVNDIEYETFVHGALCTALSGACYLSAMLGGRSGNRGLCAQPCRLDFKCSGCSYALSLKDMSYIDHIHALKQCGVTSFKIEGRMKRPEYVAAAVTACRNAVEGKPYDAEMLKNVFSRSGFTQGYLLDKRGPEMQGIRTKDDADAASEVYGRIRALYRNERQSVPVDLKLEVREGKPMVFTAKCENLYAVVTGDIPEKAERAPVAGDTLADSCRKTGGTPFIARNVDIGLDDGLSAASAKINAMRREALSKLLEERSAIRPHIWNDTWKLPEHGAHFSQAPSLRARFETAEQIPEINDLEYIYVPIEKVIRRPELIDIYGDKLIAELPHALFPADEDDLERKLENIIPRGLHFVSCDNVYGIVLAKRLGLKIFGGFGLNITNTNALDEYKALGLEDAVVSFELNEANIRFLGSDLKRGAIVYGRLPLMRLRRCPNKRKNGCGDCRGYGELEDRMGVAFPLLCHEKRYTTVLNSVPLWTADKPLRNIDFGILYFTVETAREVKEIIRAHVAGEKAPFPHTYGLYGRKLL